MNVINKPLKWIDTYFATVVMIGIGLFFLMHQFERPNLETPDNLMPIEGNVLSYSFRLKPGHKATLQQYYISLDNYPATFQLKADLIPYFYQSRFEDEIKIGDKIQITIPKDFKDQLFKNEIIFILSASKDGTNYLSLKETIQKENDKFDAFAGVFFIMGGVVTYYILKRRKSLK